MMLSALHRLQAALDHVEEGDYTPYLRLRAWLHDEAMRNEFRTLFTEYYGLNQGGLTDAWRDAYFAHLFAAKPTENLNPYTDILLDLYDNYPRRQNDHALQCSFVSKLVSIHDEEQPLYDKHVAAFFGIRPPTTGTVAFRIDGFLRNLFYLRQTYLRWAGVRQFHNIIRTFRQQHTKLVAVGDTRLFDFLVWTAGNRHIA